MKEWFIALTERIKSPFYWAFIFSWSIVNWKVFVILFNYTNCGCDCGIIKCIKHFTSPASLVGWPLVGALTYIGAVSVLDFCASWFKDKIIRNLYLEHVKYNKETLVSGTELRRKDGQIAELQESYAKTEKDKSDLYNEIKTLNSELTRIRASESNDLQLRLPLNDIFDDSKWLLEVKKKNSVVNDYTKIIFARTDSQIAEVIDHTQENIFVSILVYKYSNFNLDIVGYENISVAKNSDENEEVSRYIYIHLVKNGNIMEGFFRFLEKNDHTNNETRNVTLYKQGSFEYQVKISDDINLKG